MSEKSNDALFRSPAQPDPRVRFSREVLGDALILLLHEQPFEQITVQQILDRAGVGRSTFYAHYTGKQDLFLSDVEDFFEGMATYLDRTGAHATRLFPVGELFRHVAEQKAFYRMLDGSGKLAEVRALGIGCFAQSIERRLMQRDGIEPGPASRATAQALAGAVFALLDGWIDRPDGISPEAADTLFHQLAARGDLGLRPRL